MESKPTNESVEQKPLNKPEASEETEKAELVTNEEITESIEENSIEENLEESEKDEFINPVESIKNLEGSLSKVEARIAHLEEILKVQESLPGGEFEDSEEQKAELEGLKKQQEELESEKEDAERLEDLEVLLQELNKLPPAELRIIIETGKMSDGKELQSKHGKVSPEVAKSLAQAAEDGVTKLTKAFLKTILAVVKGVIKGIFQAVAEVAGEK